MTKNWKPEHYAMLVVAGIILPLVLSTKFVDSPILASHILAVAGWGLPIFLALPLSACLRTGEYTYRSWTVERRDRPMLFWSLVWIHVGFLALLILGLLRKPVWKS